MATYDYEVTIETNTTREAYVTTGGRPALAVSRALDLYQRAHKRATDRRHVIVCTRLGVHKRPTCEGTCSAQLDAERTRCGAPCTLLDNHVPAHRCAEHGRELAGRRDRPSMDPFAYGAPGVPEAGDAPDARRAWATS